VSKAKNIVWLFIAVSALLFSGYVNTQPKNLSDLACAFCDKTVLDIQKFYEDDLVIGLLSYKPVSPGHVLVIPKRHVERFENLANEEILCIGHLVKKIDKVISKIYGTSAYFILQKNGFEVGQTVPHVHFHYIPRKAGSSPSLFFLIKFFLSQFKWPLTEEQIRQQVFEIKKELLKLPRNL